MVLRSLVVRAFGLCFLFFLLLVDKIGFAINGIERDNLQEFVDSTVQSPTTPTIRGSTKRHILQRRRQSRSEDEMSCRLSADNVSRIYFQSSRQWLVTDEVLDTVDNDVQLIIECANEDDSIFFRTSSVIRPTRTLNVTKNLTLGTQHEPDFTENGSQISTSEMTRFTCPESRQLITSQSPSFTLRDLVIEDCNSTSSIIELDTECDQQGSVGTVRLFRIFIENNAVFGEAHIIDSRPRSCLHLELDDVLMRQNLCAIGSCMLLPPNNTLSNIQLFKNEGVNDSSSKSAIFSASKDSYTTAINVTSEGNQIRSFSVSNGTLIIVDSNFSGNTWNLSSLSQTRVNSIGGGVVFSNHSLVSISRTIFEHNYALNGGGIFALSSNVSINSCQFVGNDAGDGDGGALYGHYNSSFDISASLFFRNLGYVGAGLYSNYTTGVSIVNSKILENNCNRSCNFYINNGFASVKATEFIQNSAKQAGAALCANTTNIILENSTFVANSAKFGGACVFYFGSKVRGDELFFDNNEARVTNGGGICLLSESHMELRNSTFQRNKARGHGGAVYATRSSKLSISQCYFSRNEAQFGGAIYGHDSINGTITNSNFIENQALFTGGAIGKDEFSNGVISNCSFTNNIADLYGGSIFLEKNTTLIVLNSNLANNEARFGGSLFLQDLSTLNVSDCIFTNHIAHSYGGVILVQGRSLLTLVSSKLHNNRAENGGTLCFSDSSNGILLNNTFNNNSALVDGGAINVHVDSSLSLFGSLFSSNYAVHGGVIYVFRSFLSIRSATFNFNNATFGATVYGKNATMNFTDTIFEANRAIESGGAILVTKSNLTLDNNTIQYNEAIEDCGGICAIHGSRIDARKLIVKSNLAEDRGGGIGLGNASSILCDQCIVTNNEAYSGAGLHIYSNNSIVIVARLLDSLFKGNFAQSHGGGISFDAPSDRRINCKNNDVICGYVILLNTSFVENYANHSGAAILSTFASGVLIDCDYKGRSRGFLNQNDFESLEPLNPKQLCPSWIGNRVHPKGHGDIIGTYGHESLITIEQDEEVRLVEYASNGYVLENVSSGKRLPIIYIKILDEFGVGPAPTLPNLFEARLSSQDGFIHREYPANFLAGSGNFSEVIGFASSGNYTLEIKFNNPALEMVNLTVIVRECNIGEEPTLDKLACQKCDAFSYNFNPDQVRGCTQCPYGGNCTRKYIAPKKGYWHKSPCHNSVQECLVEEACNYENRYVALTNFTRNFSICNFTEIEVELYNDILCNEGYEGSLCGSCKKSYGLSATFLCLKCSRTILSMLMILGITMYLLATTAITIRGCLPISLKNEDDLSKSDTSSSLSEHLERDPEVNIEMVKMLVEGYIEREFSKESQIPNTSQIHATENQLKEEYELTRWRITEIFKIMINFLQTTALAANVNVQWTNGMLSLFEYSKYIGALTFVAISRPVDCLMSSSSSFSRAIWRTMVSIFVLGVVMGILFLFWSIISHRHSKGWGYFLKRCTLSVISVFYISYLGLTEMAVRAFYCIDVYDSLDYSISSKYKVWANDTSIGCYGKDHFRIILIAVLVLIIVTICFPLLSSIVLFRKKEKPESRDSWLFETAGFLFRAFEERLAFWESVVMFRKACLSIIVVFSYPLGGDSQGLLVSLLLFLCLHIHLTLRPYREEFKSLNHFESSSLLVSGSTFILSLFFVIGRGSDFVRTFLAIFIIVGNITFFVVLLLALFYSTMIHIRVILQCNNIPLPYPPTWWNILKVYLSTKLAKCWK